MKYLITIYGDESAAADATPEQMKEIVDAWGAITEEMTESGAFLAGEGLQPSATATTVRNVGGDGETTVTDGPFAESKEQLGGFYLLECDDLDEALGWAKKLPMRGGDVEVRPTLVFDEAPASEEAATAEASA
jgi:hypothetical protein